MLPELLVEIIKRVERCDDTWPVRRDVVSCGCVCKRWRDVTREVVLPPVKCGLITFPSCLKQAKLFHGFFVLMVLMMLALGGNEVVV
ncbi:F-box domain, cyclin-like protein [Artemisia annua]|uniref:F-box domain, cyclin-like protein n=1 Tax=Artemisia annua TaxID=35608 RepID=A0A2U1PE58_ARTAN|nr:F-box domain, cyclin-like protein [Artemisia annua]